MLHQAFVLSRHSEILFCQVVGGKRFRFFFFFFLVELNYLKLNIFNPVSRMQTFLSIPSFPF